MWDSLPYELQLQILDYIYEEFPTVLDCESRYLCEDFGYAAPSPFSAYVNLRLVSKHISYLTKQAFQDRCRTLRIRHVHQFTNERSILLKCSTLLSRSVEIIEQFLWRRQTASNQTLLLLTATVSISPGLEIGSLTWSTTPVIPLYNSTIDVEALEDYQSKMEQELRNVTATVKHECAKSEVHVIFAHNLRSIAKAFRSAVGIFRWTKEVSDTIQAGRDLIWVQDFLRAPVEGASADTIEMWHRLRQEALDDEIYVPEAVDVLTQRIDKAGSNGLRASTSRYLPRTQDTVMSR